MSQMPQNLAARYKSDFAVDQLASRRRIPMATPPRWSTRSTSAARPRASAGYSSASCRPRADPIWRYSALDSRTQATVANQYATSELGQAHDHQHARHARAPSGRIRRHSPRSSPTSTRTPTQPTPASRPRRRCSARSTPPRCSRSTRSRTPTSCSWPPSSNSLSRKSSRSTRRTALINNAIYFQQNFPTTMQNVNGGRERFHAQPSRSASDGQQLMRQKSIHLPGAGHQPVALLQERAHFRPRDSTSSVAWQ